MTDEQLVDRLLLEWSWRCEKGYPDLTNEEDLRILENQLGINFQKEIKEAKQKGDYVTGVLKYAGVEESVIQTVMQDTLYRKAKDVDDFRANLQQYVIAFKHFYSYAKGALGPGELIPFLSIEGSRLGGSNEKDITDLRGKVLEVKEISKSKGAGEFRTATSGKIIDSPFLKNYDSFREALKFFYEEGLYGDSLEELFRPPSGHSLGSIYLKYLNNLVTTNFPLDKTALSDDFEVVSFRGKSYAIKKGDTINFQLDGKGNLVNEPPEVEEAKVALQKVLKHPWVTGKTSPNEDLEELRERALQGIDYFLFYKKEKNPVEFARVVERKEFDQIKVGRITLGALNLVYTYED